MGLSGWIQWILQVSRRLGVCGVMGLGVLNPFLGWISVGLGLGAPQPPWGWNLHGVGIWGPSELPESWNLGGHQNFLRLVSMGLRSRVSSELSELPPWRPQGLLLLRSLWGHRHASRPREWPQAQARHRLALPPTRCYTALDT